MSDKLGTFVAFGEDDRSKVTGRVHRFTKGLIIFELVHSNNDALRTSGVLPNFCITVHGRSIYSGKAVVHRLIETGTGTLCEATLEDTWLKIDPLSGQPADQQRDFRTFMQQWQRHCKIQPEFKVLIADMQSFLAELRLWTEQWELDAGLRAGGESPNDARAFLERFGAEITRSINFIWADFERLASGLSPDLQGFHRTYVRRCLHPFILSSPFAHRTFTKPLGYAGDFEMVNMILRDPCEGPSLFSKIINLWFLGQGPAEAHRNRVQVLQEVLLREVLRVVGQRQRARVFNLGCGPAAEVKAFLSEHRVADSVSLTLVDFNNETLACTRASLDKAKKQDDRITELMFVNKSVQQLLREAARASTQLLESEYDFVYCAGLFDYLPDEICKRLTGLLYRMVVPGGLLLVTNVYDTKTFLHSMDHLLDWHLICRNARELAEFAPDNSGDVSVKSDFTGANIVLEVRKPTHA